MLYFFIINGRGDIRHKVDVFLAANLRACDVRYEKYYTAGVGDGTRFVRMFCDLFPREEVCFISCGGSGTANEVASGIVGAECKSMAILAFGETNDVIRYWPDRDFKNLGKLLAGETKKTDIIKVGDNYSLNMINVGFDGMVAYDARRYMDRGMDALRAYRKSVMTGLLKYRYFRVKMKVDGEPVSSRYMLMCPIGNGQWCGGQFHSLPEADNEDGLMDVLLVRPMPILFTFIFFMVYLKGNHLKNWFTKLMCRHFRAGTLEIRSKDLLYLCLDGEFTASTSYDISVLPSEISLVIPAHD